MATGLLTNSFAPQNFYVGYLTADVTSGATDIFIDTPPSGSEGTLVIDPDNATGREIIYYSSRTSTKVTTPANGRGYDGTTALAHTTGTKVIMAPVADWFNSMRTLFTTTPQGWTGVGYAPSAVTALGNRSYSLTFSAVDLTASLSPGMRLRTTRTVAAPTQSTSLNGTTQYFSRASASLAGFTFTDTPTISAWVKPAGYPGGSIASRYVTATSGWEFQINGSGQVLLEGANGANNRYVTSYQSVPLNKWVHVAATINMASNTGSIYIDGALVPSFMSGSATSILQGSGNLEIGRQGASGGYFNGKLAQVAIFSAALSQATIQSYMSQGLAGTETSLISAYSFNNSITDLNTTNANNLTANGSAVATNVDSPFTQQANGTPNGTLDYGIIQSVSFSTNTTVVLQVPEGNTIPTSGGISAVSYSTQKAPYGMPIDRGKWTLYTLDRSLRSTTSTTPVSSNDVLTVPIGNWRLTSTGTVIASRSATSFAEGYTTLSASSTTEDDTTMSAIASSTGANGTITIFSPYFKEKFVALAAATTYYQNIWIQGAGITTQLYGSGQQTTIAAENALL